MAASLKFALLVNLFLVGCASHQLTPQPLTPTEVTPFETMQLQVSFATPAQSTYLAKQLINALAKHGVSATLETPRTTASGSSNHSALLQLTLTDSWTETFISHRVKHRRSLTQMRGRIERESPRFRSTAMLQDLQTGRTVWQAETLTAGPWYSDFNTNARSLAAKLVRELQQQGLIAPRSDPASS